jgi:hypothetical protein
MELSDLSVSNALVASGSLGSIFLNRVHAGSYQLDTNSGSIAVDGAQGSLRAASDLGDIQVTAGSDVNLDLQSESGALSYSGSLGSGPHTVRTGLGSVHLTIPRNSALTYDFSSDLGELVSDFSIPTNDALVNKRWSGTLNGGGVPLVVETNSGSIYLNILNP